RFQIIVVDGYARSRVRYQCAQRALPHLDSNGLIILDNADWLPASALFLRRAGLIEVDFSGPVPETTTLKRLHFFSPETSTSNRQVRDNPDCQLAADRITGKRNSKQNCLLKRRVALLSK